MIGDFLRGIYLELFERKSNVSRILQGLAGRDVRQALEMFVSILNSGHLREEAITSTAKGGGEFSIEEYVILRILMRTEYRFFSNKSGFVTNIFHIEDNWENPSNFLISDILFYLSDNRKVNGCIGLEGYFTVDSVADILQLYGYTKNDVISACKFLVKRQLIEADHLNKIDVGSNDSVKITASGFIHLKILCERLEYIYGVLCTTPIADDKIAGQIADYVQREGQTDSISPHQMAACIDIFHSYLHNQHRLLSSNYPRFGEQRTGASFTLSQISSALDYFRNPRVGNRRRAGLLDK